MEKTAKKIFVFLLAGIMSVSVSYAQCDGWSLYEQGIVLMKEKKQFPAAIEKFKAASNCDPNDSQLKKQCSERIAECNSLTPKSKDFGVSKKLVKISANGGNDNVVVSNGKIWTVTSNEDWCKVQQNNNTFSVVCLPNESIVERRAIVTVTSGNENQITEIVQSAGVERLAVTTADITFAARGNEVNIEVTSNTEWLYSGIPSWCEVTQEGNQLKIKATPNNTAEKRSGSILVNSRTKELKIPLVQLASNEGLEVSTKTLTFGYAGGSDEIKIYGSAGDWMIEKFPEWCLATKKNDYTVSIECIKNSTTKSLEGAILIRSGNNQQVGIKVLQNAGVPSSEISISIDTDSKIVGGKNISFGISAGFIIPSFSIGASSDYLGSAVNYAYDAEIEKAKYSSGTGFTIGLIADIRLVKNLYLQTGLNFTTFSMENKFKGEFSDEIEMSNTTYVQGTAYDNFTEKYNLNYIEIPFLLSYRFKLSETVNWQLNAGPYIGYGISGKCDLNGTTNWPLLTEYYYSNDNLTGETYEMNCKVTGEFDLFGTTGSRKDSYTTGQMSVYDYDYDFDAAPFKKLNAGLSFGTSIEFSGFNLGISYDMGLTNIANDDYWTSDRFEISDYQGNKIEDYKHKINRFQIKLAYIFR